MAKQRGDYAFRAAGPARERRHQEQNFFSLGDHGKKNARPTIVPFVWISDEWDLTPATAEKVVVAVVSTSNFLVLQRKTTLVIERNQCSGRGEFKGVTACPIHNVVPWRHTPVFDVASPTIPSMPGMPNKGLAPNPAEYRDLNHFLRRPPDTIVAALVSLPEPASPSMVMINGHHEPFLDGD